MSTQSRAELETLSESEMYAPSGRPPFWFAQMHVSPEDVDTHECSAFWTVSQAIKV